MWGYPIYHSHIDVFCSQDLRRALWLWWSWAVGLLTRVQTSDEVSHSCRRSKFATALKGNLSQALVLPVLAGWLCPSHYGAASLSRIFVILFTSRRRWFSIFFLCWIQYFYVFTLFHEANTPPLPSGEHIARCPHSALRWCHWDRRSSFFCSCFLFLSLALSDVPNVKKFTTTVLYKTTQWAVGRRTDDDQLRSAYLRTQPKSN